MNGDEAIKFLRFLKKPISQTELQEFKELFDKEVTRVAGENDALHGVIGRFCTEQLVMWNGLQYWVVEDNGEDKVLVANSKTRQHPEYNDWWVNRDKLNAL